MHTFELRQWLKEKKHKRSPWGEVLDSNGYSMPLFDTVDGTCILCGLQGDTARHEIYYGTADRKTSKATGCWICVCPRCHEKIHARQEMDDALKKSMQILFERKHTNPFATGVSEAHEEFLELFGKNYL